MRKVLAVVMAALMLGPMVPPPARAQAMKDELAGRAPECFNDLARKLEKGKQVTLRRSGQEPVTGRFECWSADSSRLVLQVQGDATVNTCEFPLGEISSIEYREHGRANAGAVLGGFLIGAIVGAGVGTLAADNYNKTHGHSIFDGGSMFGALGAWAAWTGGGALLGMFTGAALSAKNHTRTIECGEQAP
jgi:hypothetical protein